MNDKKSALVDVSVLMLFFNRPDSFQRVFEQVRQARPARLFLYQDGPRDERDLPGIEACRQIVADENIDWECEVHRLYQERNYGCDPSGYMSHTWAFSLTDKCIVLEDDVVPSQTFFPFCKEMLDRYEHDERITMIAGFNVDEETSDVQEDYFFTSAFSIWGWASWRRVVSQWQGDYAFMDDPQAMRQLRLLAKERHLRSDFFKMCQDHRASGKQYFESIFWSCMLLNSGLAIMPRVNLISNVGATDDSTHYTALRTMPSGLRRIFTMQRHELQFPLRHPRYVVEHLAYRLRLYRVNAWGHPWVKVARSLEELLLNLRYGNFRHIGRSILRRLNKWLGRDRHV
ncbi:MAG: hemolysin activation protein [Prevotella sp.]|nr:hemolysin activation protein [Prevotella sp.]